MIQPATPLLFLLDAIKSASGLQTYHYFPRIIVAGDKCIERIDFEYLLSHQYIKETKVDHSGKSYTLTNKAELILNDSLQLNGKEDIIYALN